MNSLYLMNMMKNRIEDTFTSVEMQMLEHNQVLFDNFYIHQKYFWVHFKKPFLINNERVLKVFGGMKDIHDERLSISWINPFNHSSGHSGPHAFKYGITFIENINLRKYYHEKIDMNEKKKMEINFLIFDVEKIEVLYMDFENNKFVSEGEFYPFDPYNLLADNK